MKTKFVPAILIGCAACFLVSAVVLIVYIHSFFAPDSKLEVSGRHELNHRVFYLENEIFDGGAIPMNHHYLMSFTFIEVENLLSVNFSQPLDLSYHQTAAVVLTIRHIRTNGGSANPIVHEVRHILSEDSGSTTSESLNLSGGVFVIEPKNYIDTYFHFVAEQQAKMLRENVVTERTPQFTADLSVVFTYQLQSDGGEINETMTRGYTIPLTSEVYSFEEIGTVVLNKIISLRVFELPNLFILVLMILWFTAHVSGVCFCLRKLTQDKNELRRILARYADEIAITKKPVDLSKQKIISLESFNELLKLAINTGKQIICHQNRQKADFWVLVDGCAYCYNLVLPIDKPIRAG